jgi:hypothetical protein
MSASASAPPNEGYQQDRGIPASQPNFMSAEFNPQFRVALGSRGAPPRAAGNAPPSHDPRQGRSGLPFQPALRERIVLR